MSHFAVTYNTLALTVNFLFCWGKSKINLEMNTLREIPTDWKAYFWKKFLRTLILEETMIEQKNFLSLFWNCLYLHYYRYS